MPYRDLREWLRNVEARGELKKFSGASWDLEMASMTDMLQKQKKLQMPAVLFDDVPGFPKGFRTLFAPTSSPWRLAHTLGLPEDQLDRMSLVKNWRNKRSTVKLIPPRTVKDAPVQENIDTGDRIDLYKFPVPMCHDLDGGRFIGTACSVVQKDPDEGWVNLGTYRGQVIDRNHIAFHAVEAQHGRTIANKYFSRGQTMPIAVAIGVDPALYISSSQPMTGWGVSEYDFAGGVKGEPIEVFEGLTGLPLPARAEIIIEGECRPGEMADEGPFGEFHGYYPGKAGTAPVVTVERVYFRNDPILVGSPPAKPPNDYSYSKAVMRSALLMDALAAAGVPDVQAVWAHEIGGARMFNVVSIKQRYAGHARQAGHILSQCGVGAYMSRWSVVVDEDIDPANLQEVMWAVATRTDPAIDIDIIQRGMGSKNDPMYVAYPYNAPLSSKAIVDACRPWDHLDEFPPVAEASKELQEKVRAKWKEIL